MQSRDIKRLAAMTAGFYAAQSQSFSETRQSPWPGWEQLLPPISQLPKPAGEPLRVLDLGCGNLRFEQFLTQELAGRRFEFHAIDSCPALPQEGFDVQVSFKEADIIGQLLDGGALQLGVPQCDVVVAFGLLHHLPTNALRLQLLQGMAALVHPGGLMAASFWQFALEPNLAAKARAAHEAALEQDPSLRAMAWEEGDYLLGWQGKPGVHRFCHSFAKAELDSLADALPDMQLQARYHADGRTGRMNAYLLWTKRS